MPKRHSSALSYPGLLFKAVFFRKNTHTQDLVSITVFLLLFLCGLREPNSFFQEMFILLEALDL